ncbi:aminopeptidase P family protein [Paroceanicella profunda]|uniref:Aminopeptidase P family protein n=2 Tax=Paroceanicella profunda TaxID=2579971 RepID=A0A5B8G438_9RHOB|nr:aminopeptidase P family protein [Paroceanicella profunda]
MTAPETDSPPRYAVLREAMVAAGLDAVALVPGANFMRIFGRAFHQNERPLVVLVPLEGRPAAVVPALEEASFASLGFEGEVFLWRDEEGYQAAFTAAAHAIPAPNRIGVEGQRMRVFEQFALHRALPAAACLDAQSAISRIRLLKTAEDIGHLREAIRRSEAALEETLGAVRLGMTEAEIERILVRNLFDAGVQELSFAPIVAAAGNAAEPHAVARQDYPLAAGDALLFDFGGTWQGYRADITRTVFAGEVSDADRAFYESVRAANAAGRAAVRPGLTCGALDDVVLRVLEASPHAGGIIHKTGHGLGLDVHEDPYIQRGNDTALEPGMVFTIEPGLYRSGRIGVRIEDNMVVTETGGESLTSFPRSLRIVG